MYDLGLGDKKERPLRRDERIAVIVMVTIFCGAMSAEILLNDFRPTKLSAFFIPLFWMPLVAIHEAGHAIVAHLCGWRVKRVVIGFGRRLKTFKVGRTPVHLLQIPIQGYVLPQPRDLKSPRLKNTLIYAAGPGIEILLVLIIYLIIGHDTMFSRVESVPIVALQSFCIAAALGIVINLIPMTTDKGSWNDGMGILRSWTIPDEHFKRWISPEEAKVAPPEFGLPVRNNPAISQALQQQTRKKASTIERSKAPSSDGARTSSPQQPRNLPGSSAANTHKSIHHESGAKLHPPTGVRTSSPQQPRNLPGSSTANTQKSSHHGTEQSSILHRSSDFQSATTPQSPRLFSSKHAQKQPP